jgi:hypothetical protein
MKRSRFCRLSGVAVSPPAGAISGKTPERSDAATTQKIRMILPTDGTPLLFTMKSM